MAYRREGDEIVIDGFEKGIAQSPYVGIANIQNVNTTYYPGVAYLNYKRKEVTYGSPTTQWFAGTHSTDVSNNTGWTFSAGPATATMTNPVSKTVSSAGLKYIQDDTGQIWKQDTVNGTSFTVIGKGNRLGNGNKGIAYWNHYLVVFGDGLIEFCGDGTGDSTIDENHWNLNVDASQVNETDFTVTGTPTSYITLTFPVMYPTSVLSNLPVFQNASKVVFSTTGSLPSGLEVDTVYYLATTNVRTEGGKLVAVSLRQEDTFQYLSGSVSSGATSATLATAWTGQSGNYMVVFSSGEEKEVYITNGSASLSWSIGLTTSVTADIQVCVVMSTSGTGTHTIKVIENPLPLGNYTVNSLYYKEEDYTATVPRYIGFSFDGSVKDQNNNPLGESGKYATYTTPKGETVTGVWKEATGFYYLISDTGWKTRCNLTYNSPEATFVEPLDYVPNSTSFTLQLIDTTVDNYKPYVSKNNANLLFANGVDLAQIIYVPATGGLNFCPAIPQCGVVAQGNQLISLTNQDDTITDMTDLNTNLVIGGQKLLYTWDYVSGSVNSPVPIGETIKKIDNVMNVVYILAGQKGNIYISNGYSVQMMAKLPDQITGVIDPVWNWGDAMFHRSRLFASALAQDTLGTNLLAGVFSMIISPSILGEQASGMIFESQYSYGLVPPAGALANSLLMDAEPSSNGQDSYYTAWSNGASSGGIDYNDTSVWDNFEGVIETDMIPIGNYLDRRTLGEVQFKFDRPMVSGDQISLYSRTSLSDTYKLIGTTATGYLDIGGNFPSNQSQNLWAQFKVELKGATSGSSRLPLREIRFQIQ